MVKHKSKYSCKSAVYFKLNSETIKVNSRFKFYNNKTDIAHTILDGGNEIIWQISPMISTLYAALTMTYKSRYPVIHMY